ncbi:uncharacterized protein Dwil_GK22529 [Drosophila willistoni]|uniref:Uncharacterized protein n=1 Tax=Drosophila willistoni TaxID=7260 RepID=B4NFG7_DROWI|nr:uncharacterized protein LOC6649471 [Drosophila willistoni]EDW83034.1 uncharacterized protein Dwil_GK22529 [Drosophila willistoni]
MSLASIKQKELKGKKKVLPKLRTVLANPYKQYCPVLPENELQQFCNILEEAKSNFVSKGGKPPMKNFASHSHINLGLESCLRAIHGQRFSCIFISLSLRPTHLIRLIGTSASVKIPTASIFAQSKLEDLTFKLFGVKSMALTLPLELKNISEDLDNWVTKHQRPLPAKPIVKKRKIKEKTKLEMPPAPIKEQIDTPDDDQDKQWTGDYISCSNKQTLSRIDPQLEAQQLGVALTNLAMKAKENPLETESKVDETPMDDDAMEVDEPENLEDTEDEFLETDLSRYRPLTINVIRQNPNKKPKKKRNKKPASKTK